MKTINEYLFVGILELCFHELCPRKYVMSDIKHTHTHTHTHIHTYIISHSAQNNKLYIYTYTSRLLVSAHNVPAEAVATDIVQRLLCRQTQHFACVKHVKYVHVPYAGV